MFNSLSSRLWLTYAVLIIVVICGITFGLFISLRQSPILYRASYFKLNLAKALLVPRLKVISLTDFNQLKNWIKNEVPNYQVRMGIIDKNGTVVFDSQSNDALGLPTVKNPQN